jgi:hypothetical protein
MRVMGRICAGRSTDGVTGISHCGVDECAILAGMVSTPKKRGYLVVVANDHERVSTLKRINSIWRQPKFEPWQSTSYFQMHAVD